jgi:dihydroorotase
VFLLVNQGDLLIRGGTVVDPMMGLFGQGDIMICGSTIQAIEPGQSIDAKEVIHADGYLVTPGLIDYHTHIFFRGTESGFAADLSLLPMGVTTAVDQGSAGSANADIFMQGIANNSLMRIFCTLNVSPAGQVTEHYTENLDPRNYDLGRLRELFGRYADRIVGLKLRHGQEVVREFGMEPLKATLNLADALNCRVVVHSANPPGTVAGLTALLRAGDVCCHCYHGRGDTIIGQNGKVRPEIWEARERGVLFDTADGRTNHSYTVIQSALASGFAPDIISTWELVREYGFWVAGGYVEVSQSWDVSVGCSQGMHRDSS